MENGFMGITEWRKYEMARRNASKGNALDSAIPGKRRCSREAARRLKDTFE